MLYTPGGRVIHMKTKTQSRLLLAGISFLLLATLALLLLSTGALAASNIHGTVTDAETDDPIADANVLVYDPEDRENYHETTTDTEGFYEVEVNPGHYNIQISKDGYEDHEGEEDVGIEEQVEHNAELEPEEETYQEGYVTDADTSAPIEGAEVKITNERSEFTGTTDGEGYYNISCHDAEFSIAISHADHETHEGSVTIESGANTYDAELSPNGGGGGNGGENGGDDDEEEDDDGFDITGSGGLMISGWIVAVVVIVAFFIHKKKGEEEYEDDDE